MTDNCDFTKEFNVFKKAWQTGWLPPPQENAWAWAEKHIRFPRVASPRPMQYDTSDFPFVRRPLELVTDPRVKYISKCWAAQSSKTTTDIIAMLYLIANDPSNKIVCFPNSDIAQDFQETRLVPMIEENPIMMDLKPSDRNAFRKQKLTFNNQQVLWLVGGNSATQLASRSAKHVMIDEIDKLPKTLKGEANPIALIIERAKWFHDAKIFLSSTPTTDTGNIWIWYQKGSMEQYHVLCYHCEHHFYPEWKNVRWSDEDMTIEQKAETGHILCPQCGGGLYEKHKRYMLKNGVWVSQNPEAPTDHKSFHATEILSPITPLPDLIKKFLVAKGEAKLGDVTGLQNFVNSSLSEPWKEDFGRERKSSIIKDLRTDLPEGMIPKEALGLVMGIDTQDDGFYYIIRAFGKFNKSWLIQNGYAPDFDFIRNIATSEFAVADGRKMRVSLALQDAMGHRTDDVYNFCRTMSPLIKPIKGWQKRATPYSFSDVDKNKDLFTDLQLVNLDTTHYKDTIARRLNIKVDEEGAYLMHAGISDDYANQMVSEFRDDEGIWQCPRHKANHYWDCEVYAWAAADILQVQSWNRYFEPVKETTPTEGRKRVDSIEFGSML